MLYLKQETEDPDVASVSYEEARTKLVDALANIKEIRLEQERRRGSDALSAAHWLTPGRARLALDEFEDTDFTQRPHLPLDGALTGPTDRAEAAEPVSSLLSPIELDALTVADDASFLDRVAAQINLPDYLVPGLRSLYGS